MSARPLVLIAGIGEGLGASLAATFAGAGFDVLGLSRSDRVARPIEAAVREQRGTYTHLPVDLTDAAELSAVLRPFAHRVDVLVHTAHQLLIKPSAETTPQEFEAVWRVGCLSAMQVASEISPAMATRGSGTIIFSGATASIRGGVGFSAFASAKFALRGFAQALARELGPRGVHVAHVILDGLIDEAQTTARFGPGSTARMDPDSIAAAYLALARQHRSAWSHEIDLRPFTETF
jgi:NAD(P)-dependent dehydrogenase (short-subunit alcohol dehydrogenase family)